MPIVALFIYHCGRLNNRKPGPEVRVCSPIKSVSFTQYSRHKFNSWIVNWMSPHPAISRRLSVLYSICRAPQEHKYMTSAKSFADTSLPDDRYGELSTCSRMAHLGFWEAEVGAHFELGMALIAVQGQPPPDGDPLLDAEGANPLRAEPQPDPPQCTHMSLRPRAVDLRVRFCFDLAWKGPIIMCQSRPTLRRTSRCSCRSQHGT